jgi:hypothetical protein
VTVSGQKTDTIAVKFQVTGRSQDAALIWEADDLRYVMAVWNELQPEVRARILEIVKASFSANQ